MCVWEGGSETSALRNAGSHASECYGVLQGGLGGQNGKFLPCIFFVRPLTRCSKKIYNVVQSQHSFAVGV